MGREKGEIQILEGRLMGEKRTLGFLMLYLTNFSIRY